MATPSINVIPTPTADVTAIEGKLGVVPTPDGLNGLMERLRALDGQLLALLLGQLPSNRSSAPFLAHFVQALQQPSSLAAPTVGSLASGTADASLRVGNPLLAAQPTVVPMPSPRPTPQSVTAPNAGSAAQESVMRLIVQTAQRRGVDPALALAVACAESNFNPNAVSPKGAIGVMQLMPATASALGVTDPFDPAHNIDGGIRYLRHLLERFNGQIALAVAAYNAGPNAVQRYGGVPPYPETQTFVRRVLGYWQIFRDRVAHLLAGTSSATPTAPSKENALPAGQSPHFSVLEGASAVSPKNEGGYEPVSLRKEFVSAPSLVSRAEHHPLEPSQLPGSSTATNHGWRIAASAIAPEETSLGAQKQPEISSERSSSWRGVAEAGQPTPFPSNAPVASQPSQVSEGASRPAPSASLSLSEAPSTPLGGTTPRVVPRLSAEMPAADGRETIRVQVALTGRSPEPSVQVVVHVPDERAATQLQLSTPTLRQHLWEQGIALTHMGVFAQTQQEKRRDVTGLGEEWRRLPRTPMPKNAPLDTDGLWA